MAELGLEMVKELVDAQEGGKIKVQSQIEQGTQFLIALQKLKNENVL